MMLKYCFIGHTRMTPCFNNLKAIFLYHWKKGGFSLEHGKVLNLGMRDISDIKQEFMASSDWDKNCQHIKCVHGLLSLKFGLSHPTCTYSKSEWHHKLSKVKHFSLRSLYTQLRYRSLLSHPRQKTRRTVPFLIIFLFRRWCRTLLSWANVSFQLMKSSNDIIGDNLWNLVCWEWPPIIIS